jgi:hypothetical protein
MRKQNLIILYKKPSSHELPCIASYTFPVLGVVMLLLLLVVVVIVGAAMVLAGAGCW